MRRSTSQIMVPLFSLPDVVLFPQTYLPLRVFEHRYRQMVQDILDGPGRIAIALLRPGWEPDYEGNPDIYPVVTVGSLEQYRPRADGGFDILLFGEFRGRVVRERTVRPYREVLVASMPEKHLADLPSEETERAALLNLYDRLLQLSGADDTRGRLVASRLSFETLVNAVPSLVRVAPLERQRLLEIDCLLERGRESRRLLSEAIQRAAG